MNNIEQLITTAETSLINRIASDVHRTFGISSNKHEFISKNELYHYGIQGLLEARTRFKNELKIPWLAFASYRVRGNMLDNIRKLPFVKLPYEQCKKLKLIENARQRLLKLHGTVSTRQIAEYLSWTESTIENLLHQKQNLQTLSLSHEQKTDNSHSTEGVTILDSLKDSSPGPEHQLAQEEIAKLLQICMDNLPKKDKFILICRIVQDLKLWEVAESLNCSQENVRRRQGKAEKQMEKCIMAKGWSLNNCLEAIL